MKAKIRKLVTFVEETRTEMNQTIDPPTRRAAAAAVIENPFAGRYVEDLTELMEIGEELGALLTERAVLGVPLDIPLGHKDAAFVRSHFDGMEIRVGDAPRTNEILVAIAVTDSGRRLPR